MRRPFVFLDRDGTLIHDPGYVHRVEDYRLLDGVAEGLRALRAAGFGLAIVTNQSGIGRGYFGEAAFQALQRHLLDDLERQGVAIDASYHCPHAPGDACTCRKPAVGLLERAQRELGAELAASWVIGDAPSDMELAERAGCRAVWVGAPGRAPTGVPESAGVREAAALIARAGPRAPSGRA
jgi:D-glycero-D-manno-heptose 1,7-bisphosphate phosphatase